MAKGMKILLQSLGLDPEAMRREMEETVTFVRDMLARIAGALSRIEADTAYTRTAVDRLYSAVTGGPPEDTATREFAAKAIAENPGLQETLYAEIVSPSSLNGGALNG
jgi:hypothetical protein